MREKSVHSLDKIELVARSSRHSEVAGELIIQLFLFFFEWLAFERRGKSYLALAVSPANSDT